MILSPTVSFEEKALAIYDYQYTLNPIYKQFINIVRYNGFKPEFVSEIPFLPIELFKTNEIKTDLWSEVITFQSSGTSGMKRSHHLIRDPLWYLQNTASIWHKHFGSLNKYCFVSLLPNYHDNPASSLLYMVDEFTKSGIPAQQHFYRYDYTSLHVHLNQLMTEGKKVVLFGVSFALLEYVRHFHHEMAANLIVVETGGMKKHGKELTRSALHQALADGFEKARVVSEYGMTECLSQMYCLNGSGFIPNDRMRICITEPSDPGVPVTNGQRGRINIVDLANLDTISFIATDDLGQSDEQGLINILGRLDNSDLRGCNYLL